MLNKEEMGKERMLSFVLVGFCFQIDSISYQYIYMSFILISQTFNHLKPLDTWAINVALYNCLAHTNMQCIFA